MPAPRTTRGMRPQRAPTRERAREGKDFFFGDGGVAVDAPPEPVDALPEPADALPDAVGVPPDAVDAPPEAAVEPGVAAEGPPGVAAEAPVVGAEDGPPEGGVGGVGVDGDILEIIGKKGWTEMDFEDSRSAAAAARRS